MGIFPSCSNVRDVKTLCSKPGAAFADHFPNTSVMAQQYQSCIDACLQCASACNTCAAACTREEHIHMMAACIRLDMECAAICYAAAELMSLGSERSKEICRMCAEMCEACGNECGKHQEEHCKACAEACKKCADECRRMAA